MEPVDDVRTISRIAYGFIAAKALFAALDLDLFGHLPGDLASLAAASNVAPPRLRTLLASLVALGLVTRDGETFANAPASARYLVRGAPAYFGDYYRFQVSRQLYPAMTRLDAGLAGDDAGLLFGGEEGMMADATEAEMFSRAQHAGSAGPAMMLARGFDLAGRRRLLDVAGGTGAFSIALCRRNPDLRAIILDFPNVAALAHAYVAESGLSDRIATIGGNALSTAWPAGQDVVLMSYLLSAVADADIDTLFAKAAAALAPGGVLLLHDFMLDDDRRGPDLAAHWFLLNLAISSHGISFSPAELAPRLAAAGFTDVTAQEHIHDITKLMVARKPGG
jgi:ubiquinone/menaquinone biosynthesis C-methylase UbiE